jgi:hypothetical protein
MRQNAAHQWIERVVSLSEMVGMMKILGQVTN